jgi:hypothetical protein
VGYPSFGHHVGTVSAREQRESVWYQIRLDSWLPDTLPRACQLGSCVFLTLSAGGPLSLCERWLLSRDTERAKPRG